MSTVIMCVFRIIFSSFATIKQTFRISLFAQYNTAHGMPHNNDDREGRGCQKWTHRMHGNGNRNPKSKHGIGKSFEPHTQLTAWTNIVFAYVKNGKETNQTEKKKKKYEYCLRIWGWLMHIKRRISKRIKLILRLHNKQIGFFIATAKI